MIKLTDCALTQGIPQALAGQPWAQAISYAFSRQMAQALKAAAKINTWANLSTAPAEALDIYAVELHAQGYDQSLPLESKRKIVSEAYDYWARAGTNASVDSVLNSVFDAGSRVQDWYDYGGEPGYFRVLARADRVTVDQLRQIKTLIEEIKRLSAWLDAMLISIASETSVRHGEALLHNSASISIPYIYPRGGVPSTDTTRAGSRALSNSARVLIPAATT